MTAHEEELRIITGFLSERAVIRASEVQALREELAAARASAARGAAGMGGTDPMADADRLDPESPI